jgi:DNA mismatch repair endonuclease MutH
MPKYDDSSEKSIVSYAQQLVGKSLQNILDISTSARTINLKNKGLAGLIIEKEWFGIEQNSSQLPDFDKVGIELKIIPLKKIKRGIVVKERTKICSMNYMTLPDEKWEESHAKIKLNKILFIYYFPNSSDILKSKILKIDLWKLSKESGEVFLKDDWYYIQQKVIEGYAHELSCGDTDSLEASPAGTKKQVPQFNTVYANTAQKRAFSLKQPFTNQRWEELNQVKFESIIKILNITNFDSFEQAVLDNINSLQGKSILELSKLFDVEIGQSKSRVASVMKKMIGFKSVRSKIKEFEQLGIEIKMINVRKRDSRPMEAISFPAMKLQEFILEEWDESTFLPMISKILFIPIYKEHKTIKDLDELYLGKAFFWTPTNDEIDIIRQEWLNYQIEVQDGKCKVTKVSNKTVRGYKEVSELSKESITKIIHMRPHGRNSNDIDEDNLGNSIVKQSFWLNTKFIQQLIKKNL